MQKFKDIAFSKYFIIIEGNAFKNKVFTAVNARIIFELFAFFLIVYYTKII